MVYEPQLSKIITPYNLRAYALPVAQEAPLDEKEFLPCDHKRVMVTPDLRHMYTTWCRVYTSVHIFPPQKCA